MLGSCEIRARVDIAPRRAADVDGAHQPAGRELSNASAECRIAELARLAQCI